MDIVKHPIILGIESSCDDTSIALVADGEVLCNLRATQYQHLTYGGVIPELASRVHEETILPLLDQALYQTGISLKNLSGVACTRGPGLLGSLLVGLSVAKSLSMALNIPLIEVHHMQAHVVAHFIDKPCPKFPFLCLTVSGGHTQIVKVNNYLDMEIIGQTVDDAAGEAFDKLGKLIGLNYPAGPEVDRLAQEGEPKFHFPITKLEHFNYSFSGLKTAVLYFLKKQLKDDPNFIENNRVDLAASIQKAIIDNLMANFLDAAKQTSIKEWAIAGGVAANLGLRQRIQIEAETFGAKTYFPKLEYCTDNAAMIAYNGYLKFCSGDFSSLDITALARWPMP